MPKEPGTTVLDLNVLGEVCSAPGDLNDPVLLGLIALFLREESQRIERVGSLVRAMNAGDLARESHKLAGSCAVIGAGQAGAAAQALERAATAGDWDAIPSRLASLREAWVRLNATLADHNLVRA